MSSDLAAAQKRYLRGLAHPLKPLIQVGAKGVTPSLLAELDSVLERHELIKVKVATDDREVRDAAIVELVDGVKAALVQRIGNTAVLYRRSADNPQIVLPRVR
ncbi:ribosome assembly RNA-binding protein YhbY [Coralloluteibacterium stylophorae]|uniref:Ribosome assembly RNA-binding protein YhbY n=1 Tax=Coralloluteibacterium stylophorae TaxID=1776034 RepID=A0A8J7VY14_9GAMM|nr:ribosome assembly RNA-binding protein YhbY [Coralloluteibacterium stylophorae]MBS7459005.1 ribosome assembly RNA-binding protein YhbY [Coralloluteibacterium stylophorae]